LWVSLSAVVLGALAASTSPAAALAEAAHARRSVDARPADPAVQAAVGPNPGKATRPMPLPSSPVPLPSSPVPVQSSPVPVPSSSVPRSAASAATVTRVTDPASAPRPVPPADSLGSRVAVGAWVSGMDANPTLLNSFDQRIGKASTVASIFRGYGEIFPSVEGVEYRQVDIRQRAEVQRAFADLKPDVVYHLAAVRDPGLAEIEVARTIATNVTGTVHLLDAARSVGVDTFVYASTGKALRFYTSDVYAATKKVGERLVANSGLPTASFVRFTHIVDNSLILHKLLECTEGEPIRLHDPRIGFHVQSALEAAQLLEFASRTSGLYSMRDLAWPIDLLNLTLDVMRHVGRIAPIYFCGYEQGYEAEPYPGLYDPQSCGDTGPLINALESYSAAPALHGQLNAVPIVVGEHCDTGAELQALMAQCARGDSAALLRRALRATSLSHLDTLLTCSSDTELARLTYLGRRFDAGNADHVVAHHAIAAAIDGRVGPHTAVWAS
jgi:nucleoside-diphosphate-sugar epimerase